MIEARHGRAVPLLGRAVPLLACVVVLGGGLAVHATSAPWSDKTGDVLYAALVVLGLWLLRPSARPPLLAAVASTWCLAVELLQLTGVPAAAARVLPVSRLVLGSGFDALDLLGYALGIVLASVAVALMSRRSTRRHRHPPARSV